MINRKKFYVLVHPFDSDIYESQPEYLSARDSLLEEEEDLIILANDVEKTRERIKREIFIVPTEEADPLPLQGWRYLEDMLPLSSEIVFCGAELHFDRKGVPYTGCVLEAFEKLDVPYKRIDLDKCWIGE